MKKITLKDLVQFEKINYNSYSYEYYQIDFSNISPQLDQYDSIYPSSSFISRNIVNLNYRFIDEETTSKHILENIIKNKISHRLTFPTRKYDEREMHNIIMNDFDICIQELKRIPYQNNIKILIEEKYINLLHVSLHVSYENVFIQDKYKDKIIIFDSSQNRLFFNDEYYGFNLSYSHVIEIAFEDELRLKKLKRVLYE